MDLENPTTNEQSLRAEPADGGQGHAAESTPLARPVVAALVLGVIVGLVLFAVGMAMVVENSEFSRDDPDFDEAGLYRGVALFIPGEILAVLCGMTLKKAWQSHRQVRWLQDWL